MKRIKSIKLILCLILALFMINPFLNIFVQSDVIDYSSNSSSSKIISNKDIISLITDGVVTNEEKEYLGSEAFLKYEELIPVTNINTSISGNVLTIHANEYSYNDSNNRTHVWVPKSAKVGTIEKSFTKIDSIYECVIENVSESESKVIVNYESDFILNKIECNLLLNKAYNEAKSFADNRVEEIETEKYNNDLIAYNNYLEALNQYNSDYVKYINYLTEKENWDNQEEAYLEYLEEYNQYLLDLQKYNKYIEDRDSYESRLALYNQYLADLDRYNQDYEVYLNETLELKPRMDKINYHLAVMELIVTPMTSLERTIYDAVMGSTVTEVLNMNKSDLAILKADEEAIERARTATERLRELFDIYFSLENDSDKYTVYSQYYSVIKKNIEELFRCLDKLYRSGRVKEAIEVKGKTDKYLILVAQLALVSWGLDNNPLGNYEAWTTANKNNFNLPGALEVNDSWTINGKTINEILENNTYIETTEIDAYPDLNGYPVQPVEPVRPVEVEEPVYPEKVNKPVEVEAVENPGDAPTVVDMPIQPSKVECPTPYVVDPKMQGIVNKYNSGELVYRTPLESDKIITLFSSVNKNFKDSVEVTIEFYNTDGNLITKKITEKNSYIVYDGIIPSKQDDDKYNNYVFVGWEYGDHEILNLNNVTREGFVYPIFSGTLNKYTITWVINGISHNEVYEYGSIPSCKEPLVKEPNGNTKYEFNGFDKEIKEVKENITYVASFNESEIIEDGNLTINDNKATLEISNETTDLEAILDNYDGLVGLDVKADYYGLSINKTNLNSLVNDNISEIEFVRSDKGNGEYYFSINTKNNDVEVNNNYQIAVEVEGEFDINNSYLYYEKDGIEYQVRSTYSDNKLCFTMNTAYVYHYYPTYEINVIKNDYVSIKCNESTSRVNGEVTINLSGLIDGIRIDKIYCQDVNKNDVEIIDNKFIMPACDVYVGVVTSPIIYTVRFISDGFVFQTNTYKYNEDLIVPTLNPSKLSDDEYSYEFIGWSPELIKKVTTDIEYVAEFKQVENKYKAGPESKSRIIPIIIIGCSVVLVSAGAVTTLVILGKKGIIFKRKKGSV